MSEEEEGGGGQFFFFFIAFELCLLPELELRRCSLFPDEVGDC
jgi:hypothetical protein